MNDDIKFQLLGEISKNIDDFQLFMDLISGFDQFKLKIIEEFETIVLRPCLEAKILELNQERIHKFSLNNCDRSGSLLRANEGIIITSDGWLEGIKFQFAAEKTDISALYIQIYVEDSNEKANIFFNKLVKDFDLQNEIYKKINSSDFTGKKGISENGIWFFFSNKYYSITKSNEALYKMVNDINLKKLSKYCPFASALIHYFFNFIECFDSIYAQAPKEISV
jgi:hypothetical protein